jgi:hypothetical protein
MLTVVERLAERELIKQRANFIVAWSSSTIKKVGYRFHYNFKVGMQVNPSGYRGVDLGLTTST